MTHYIEDTFYDLPLGSYELVQDINIYSTITSNAIADQAFELLQNIKHYNHAPFVSSDDILQTGGQSSSLITTLVTHICPLLYLGITGLNPLAFGIESGILLSAGIAAEIIDSNSNNIADYLGINQTTVTNTANFIDMLRWPIVGMAASITIGQILEQSFNSPLYSNLLSFTGGETIINFMQNSLFTKPISTAVASLYIHLFSASLSLISYGLPSQLKSLPEHIEHIGTEGIKRNIWQDTLYYSSKKFFEELMKTSIKDWYLLEGIASNAIYPINTEQIPIAVLTKAMTSSLFRAVSINIAHKIVGEKLQPPGYHIELPIEFLSKSVLEILYPNSIYFNGVFPLLMGSLAKYIAQKLFH